MHPENRKSIRQGWDTRTWLVGILGGVVCGNVTAWTSYGPFTRHINAALHLGSAADWISGAFGFVGLLVLPGIVSGVARRVTFLWGIVPLTLFFSVIEIEDWAENGLKHTAGEFWVGMMILSICLVVSSGPVSLFRYGRARARQRQRAVLAAVVAQREAASAPREGVWPPPPDYRP